MQKIAQYVPKWFAIMIAISMGVTILGLGQSGEVTPAQQLTDVIWVDRVPQDPSESFKAHYFGVDNYGVMLDAPTCYKLIFEIFEFDTSKSKITYVRHHTGKKVTTAYKIEKMDEPTELFDTMLTIKKDPNNRGKKTVYYTGPEFRSHATLPPVLREALNRQHLRLVD